MKKLFFFLCVFLVIITPLMLLGSQKVSAAFNPSVVIDDGVFSNSGTMNATQIDNFLNSFPGSCISTNNGFSDKLPTGYNPSSGFTFGSNVTAGRIIYEAASAYDLNPQVILSTLQKEQSMVTGSAGCYPNTPNPSATFQCDLWGKGDIACTSACTQAGGCIPIAMGYNCPGNCQADSEGFSNQVIRATWKLKFVQQRSLGNYNWNIQKPGWDNSDDPLTAYDGRMTEGYRKRNPASSLIYYEGVYPMCESNGSGCANTLLVTGAAASLYSYTPFFTGNRSFVNIFEGWFGASYAPDLYSDYDSDGTVDRYDQCSVNAGSPVNFGCPENTSLESSGYSGDFNGDGYSDVLVFSAFPDSRTYNLWLYRGSSSGLADPVFQTTLGPNNGGYDLTKSKAVAVDVNGDGYTDMVIFHKGVHDEVDRHVFLGSSSGLQPDNPSMAVQQSPAAGWYWSKLRIAGAGDFNGDGKGDVLVFSVWPDGHTNNVLLYNGSATGLQNPVSAQLTLSPGNGGWDFIRSKPATIDANGDGYTDLVILHKGVGDEIWEHVFKGSGTGLQAEDTNMMKTLLPSQGWHWSNIKIAGVGDFTHDGYGDVMVLSLFPDGRTYNVILLSGSAGGLQNPSYQTTLGPNNGGWNFVKSKVVTSNVDGDFYADLVVFHQGPKDEIVRHVLRGSASGLQQSDPNMSSWQFPAQGWRWNNLRVLRSNN